MERSQRLYYLRITKSAGHRRVVWLKSEPFLPGVMLKKDSRWWCVRPEDGIRQELYEDALNRKNAERAEQLSRSGLTEATQHIHSRKLWGRHNDMGPSVRIQLPRDECSHPLKGYAWSFRRPNCPRRVLFSYVVRFGEEAPAETDLEVQPQSCRAVGYTRNNGAPPAHRQIVGRCEYSRIHKMPLSTEEYGLYIELVGQ